MPRRRLPETLPSSPRPRAICAIGARGWEAPSWCRPPLDVDRVQFGSTVTIARDDGRRQTYRIVGEDEADPAKGSISYVSPLARQLVGKPVGDSVRMGASETEIVAITR